MMYISRVNTYKKKTNDASYTKMRVDRKIVIRIITVLVLLTILLIPVFPKLIYATIYLGCFLIIGTLYFLFSIRWISVLTIFFAFAFISLGPGIYYIAIEHINMQYNPYFVILPGMLLILLGYLLGSIPLSSKRHKRKKFHGTIPWNFALYGTYLLSSAAWIIYFIRFRSLLRGNLENGRIEAMSGNGALIYIVQLHIMTLTFMFIECKKKYITKTVFWPLCVIGIFQLLSMGFRSPAAICVICLLIIEILDGKVRVNRTALLVLTLLIAATAFGIYRAGASGIKLYYILRQQFYNSMYNLDVMYRYFPFHVPFQHGYTYLINLIMLLPGPGKDFTLWLKDAIGFSFSGGGITPSVFGELYINFGNIGIYIGSFILGFVFRKLDEWIYSGDITFWKTYMLILVPSCLGGGIANIMVQPIVFGLYYLLLCVVSNPRHSNLSRNK